MGQGVGRCVGASTNRSNLLAGEPQRRMNRFCYGADGQEEASWETISFPFCRGVCFTRASCDSSQLSTWGCWSTESGNTLNIRVWNTESDNRADRVWQHGVWNFVKQPQCLGCPCDIWRFSFRDGLLDHERLLRATQILSAARLAPM